MHKYFYFRLLVIYFCVIQISWAQRKITIGFVQAIEDATLDEARKGYFDALAQEGYSEKLGNLEVIYQNAQGSIATLNTIQSYLVNKPVDILATNTTLATLSAINATKSIPIFMMVAPEPYLMQLNTVPKNLSGTYETLDYIDTAVTLITQLMPQAKRIGTIYNASEPNATHALARLQKQCKILNLEVRVKPVTQSSETQVVVESLLSEGIDVFFALPDNIIFSSFETIFQSCEQRNVPIFTSESGLVRRGATAAFGADMYAWGYQSGKMTAFYLKNKILLAPTIVHTRKQVLHPTLSAKYKIQKETSASKLPLRSSYHFARSTIVAGMLLGLLGLGVFISFKVFQIPDITADGSYTLGASITAIGLTNHFSVGLTLFLAMVAGGIAGFCSGVIHTKGKVNALLTGILVMTGLYSINLGIMGRSNVPLLEYSTIFSADYSEVGVSFVLLGSFILLWIYFFQTDLGLAMRAVGYNEKMLAQLAISADKLKVIGLVISNAVIALSGSLMAQYQGFSDINMGIGVMLSGLAGLMLGDAVQHLLRLNKIVHSILFAVIGCLIFQGIISFSLTLGISPHWLKLVSAVFVLIAVILPNLRKA
ncbi:MAG: ABC transporter substrate binding protein [Bacteroidia bacterium]|nr:ABC transporter substrate binding protein [Bacteroidia bacterium]